MNVDFILWSFVFNIQSFDKYYNYIMQMLFLM